MNEIYLQWIKERPNYRTLRQWNPSLIQSIIDRHPTDSNKMHGFIHRIIAGDMGYGKTTLAYKLMAKLDYVLNGYNRVDDEENSYKFALDNMIYRPADLFSRMERSLESPYPDYIWTIDDASIHFGKQIYRKDRDTYDTLEDNLPTIREYVTCLLITTPKLNNLAKPFRDFFDKKIKITLEEGGMKNFTRRGKHYFKEFYPDDVHYVIQHPFDDRYSCLVPEPFYTWMHDKKKAALREYHAWKKNKKILNEQEQYDDEEDDEEEYN